MNLYSGRGKPRPYIMHEKMHFAGEVLACKDAEKNHKIFSCFIDKPEYCLQGLFCSPFF
ncbi:MAG: hypothetical protein NC203_07990 [Firmicutes bacterium]|nr:hypothetical protein [[Eubacterium] siraeum]MCM1488290.1 hypothetical protein [Bacillota bacterium]